jgi:drug/metabolite transporter (DMT)-like permease
MIAGGAVLVVVGSAGGEWGQLDVSQVSLASVLAMLYLVVFGSIVALSAYVFLLRVTAASAVSTYAFVNPVVAVLLGWTLAGERLGPRTVVASVLVISAVALILAAQRRSSRATVRSAGGRSASTRASAVTSPLRISAGNTSIHSRTR